MKSINSKFSHPKSLQILLLYGPSGVGKSVLVQKLADHFGLTALWKNASSFFDMYIGNSEKFTTQASLKKLLSNYLVMDHIFFTDF